ncbi:hypothetical protein LX77_02029 [Gelidibacter algens]|uniref:Uncharacterized protein n=1 Tax=Gelidibacter algens TaxID=49280 RepID=A0A1A7R3X1_9FLAO|nr:hypothetical protein [Gelidibacter algens]OBX26159.1 hypothetical protein A9996_06435 [Gelidibacter algens]RAJ24475.1 hypothetical protein LX77_02029 [Gelidibacter algens]
MERLAEIFASWLYQSRRELKLLWLKHTALTTNRLSFLVVVIFGIVPLTLYYLISGTSYSVTQIVATYIFVTLLFSLSLLLVITWFKSEELFKNNVQGFSFLLLSSSRIDTVFFGFDSKDVENLLRLINGLPKQQKIVIRETPKNKQTGNIRFLFTLLDLIVRGGIFRMDTKPKESLNMLISERFTFQNSEINSGTLPSSYSKWCSSTHDGTYDDVRKDVLKALGISK